MLIDWKLEGRDDARLYLAFSHGAAYNLMGAILVAGRVSGPGYEVSFDTAVHYNSLQSFATRLKRCLHQPATASLGIYDIGVLDNNLDFEDWESTSLTVESDREFGFASGTVVTPSSSSLHSARLDFRFALQDGALRDSIYDFDAVLASYKKPTNRE